MTAGLILGPDFHYLDHLAPLCAKLKVPLIVTDVEVQKLALTFYPDLEVIYFHSFEAPERVVVNYETIYTCMPRPLFEQEFFLAQKLHQKKVKTIWCPHGNSDKGRHSPLMEGLKDEEHILSYGPRIEAFIKEKGIDVPMTRVGNFRLEYFKTHESFYEGLVPSKKGRVILYAPTWQDSEKNSSFVSLWPYLLRVPSHLTLWVRLHPHLYIQCPDEIEAFKSQATDNVVFIENFPPVYPILAKSDLYIGDMSSVGYDFLYFRKPLIVLNSSTLAGASTYLPKEEYGSLFALCETLWQAPPLEHSLYEETYC